jgi:hypothetical protein
MDCLTVEDGTNRLSKNIGSSLPTSAAPGEQRCLRGLKFIFCKYSLYPAKGRSWILKYFRIQK